MEILILFSLGIHVAGDIIMNSSDDTEARSVKDLLQWAVEELEELHIETSRLDAEVLLAHAMRKERLQLYMALEETSDAELESHYKSLIRKRSAHTPVSYLTGHREFMSLDFVVDENVLIPRPETEILVETVSKLGKAEGLALELGTGSGAIAVSLARYNPGWHIVATDLSMAALVIARENARRHKVIDKISFVQADLLGAFSSSHKFNWVVSNPPYIPERSLAQLPTDVREYEPMLALNGGIDGLDVIRSVIAGAHAVLKPGGRLVIEIGCGQSAEVQNMAAETGRYSDYSIVGDYSGIPRIFHCSRQET